MKIQTTSPFDRDYGGLPESVKEQTDKQLSLFLDNPHHPSLRVKKIKGYPKIWEGRITKLKGSGHGKYLVWHGKLQFVPP
jgi:mRNA interferase RelE/StbE